MAIGNGSFSGHETFPFRYAWMKKGVDAVAEDPNVFSDDEAMSILGVGKNMVRSIRHWCLATGLLENTKSKGAAKSGLSVSALGKALFGDVGFDPYLEDPATLWILHWQLASDSTLATTWYWAFGHVHEPEFTKDALLSSLKVWIQTQGLKAASDGTLERDVDCFLRTYARSRGGSGAVQEDSLDCPLVELGLILPSADHSAFAFVRGDHPTLSDGVLLYAVSVFWSAQAKSREALSLADLAHRPGSPGRVFKLDEDALATRLDRLDKLTGGGMVYDETAGLRQLYLKKEISATRALRLVYRRSPVKAGC
ncbi:MAG: DUF4007 family protein [Opitutales bacterium]